MTYLACDTMMANNMLLSNIEIREYQDLVSGTSYDYDDDVPDIETLDDEMPETFGMHEIDSLDESPDDDDPVDGIIADLEFCNNEHNPANWY